MDNNVENDYSLAFVGGFFTKEIEKDVLKESIGRIQYAANNYQFALIDGLAAASRRKLFLISELFVGNFPKRYKKAIIHRKNFDYNGNSGFQVSFINLAIILDITKSISGYRELSKWAKHTNCKIKIVFGYSLNPFILLTLSKIKKHYRDIKICLVIPDLIEYMGMDEKKGVTGYIYSTFRKSVFNRCLRDVDYYVPLTEDIMDHIPYSSGKKFCVIEGIYTDKVSTVENRFSMDTSKKIVMYSGGISSAYGLCNLIDAFHLIRNADYELLLCGGISENEKDLIISKVNADKRIRFLGQIPHDEVIQMQKNVTVLVNPRQASGEFTKYSFPSKTMEYLGSGKPVIAYKLPGIPDEYDKYLNYVNDNTVESLSNKIIEICSLPTSEREDIGLRGKRFVELEKNPEAQAKKILDIMK